MSYEMREVEGVAYFRFPNLTAPHAFSTRVGGVSQGPFASLNLGRTAGDDPPCVAENRLRFERVTGVPVRTCLRMEHGAQVALPTPSEQTWVGDACVSDSPTVAMAITTADCVPVLFHDPVTGAVGLAHAGWRGTVGGVVVETVRALQNHYGASPADLRVALAASIGPCCFLVHEDVAVPFLQRFPALEVVWPQEDRWSVDLWEANRRLLMEAGVPSSHIDLCRLCTSCRSDLFFSYRRDRKTTGRMAAVIRAG